MLRVFEIRFIEDDEDARGNLPDEGVELRRRKNGPGRIVGIGQVDDLRVLVDAGGESIEVEMVVAQGNRDELRAARTGKDVEADKRPVRCEHLVIVAEKGADDVRHDPFRSAAGDHVADFEMKPLRQDLAQFESAVGIEMEIGGMAADGFDGEGRGTEGILIGSQFCHVDDTELFSQFGNRLPRLVGLERLYIWRDKTHNNVNVEQSVGNTTKR